MKRFQNFHFKGQYPNEEILLVVRRHWFDILKQFFSVFLIILIFLFGFFALPYFLNDFGGVKFQSLILFIENSFAMLIWLYVFLIWIDYYFDVWIVTEKRIINVEQKGLFVRHISELELQKVQDVTTEIEGIIPSVLNYGDVHIQTAGTVTRFVFWHVPNPFKVKGIIMKLQGKAQRRETRKLGKAIHLAGQKKKSDLIESDLSK